MASNDNAIFLSPQGTKIKHESTLASGTAFPGMLLAYSAGEVLVNPTAEDVAPLFMLADLSVSVAGAIGTEYNTTVNDRVNWRIPQSGELVKLHMATSTVIAQGDQLGSAGNGSVKKVAVADVGVIAYALEAVTTTAATDFILAIVK